MMDKNLELLLKHFIDDFRSKEHLSFVVKDAIPIVWFGDLEKYFNSKIKILTVGLNPSNMEFSVKRFSDLFLDPDHLYSYLNKYFYYNPYRSWFSQYEKVITQLNASYGGIMSNGNYTDNIAIHADICSSIATDPTYGNLLEEQKSLLENHDLFFELLQYLSPDIILVSVKRENFYKIFQINPYRDICIYKYKNERGPQIEAYQKNEKIIVYGRNLKGTPFGVANDVLQNAFNKINSFLNTAPVEGVFWVIATNTSLIESETFKFIYHFDSHASHAEVWEQIKKEQKDLQNFDYEFFPRGRIWIIDGKVTILLNPQINKPTVIETVKRVFGVKDHYVVCEDA